MFFKQFVIGQGVIVILFRYAVISHYCCVFCHCYYHYYWYRYGFFCFQKVKFNISIMTNMCSFFHLVQIYFYCDDQSVAFATLS